jgi:hypothetical protein
MQIHPTEPVRPAADPFSNGDLNLYTESDSFELENETLPKTLVEAFAAATGWEMGRVGNEIKIVDMSATWPARTPTAHRGKCDRVAEELTKLLN